MKAVFARLSSGASTGEFFPESCALHGNHGINFSGGTVYVDGRCQQGRTTRRPDGMRAAVVKLAGDTIGIA